MKLPRLLFGIFAAASFAFSGGDMAPVETEVAPIPAGLTPYYVGLSGGSLIVNNDFTNEEITASTATLSLGYIYNEYISLEARYTLGFDTSYDEGDLVGVTTPYDGDVSNWGVYLKPTYSFGDFGIYGLLGYGSLMLSDLNGGDATEDGFQWGAGVSYAVSEHISIYAEYLSLYDDTGFDYTALLDDVTAEAVNIGLTYRF